MARPEIQLEFNFAPGRRGEPIRREPRESAVRVVEVAPLPRLDAEARPRVGFTRDLSPSGMCVGLDQSERVGRLLRVRLRELDGRPAREAIGRVVWCSGDPDHRYWVGLRLLAGTRSQRDSSRAADRRAASV